MGTAKRCFLGFEVPETARRALRQALHPLTWPGVREHEDDWHVTLVFLGRQELPLPPAVTARIALDVADCAPFHLTLQTLQRFPSPDSPLLAAEGESPSALTRLHGAAEHWAALLGREPERRAYRPHVTLSRSGGMGGLPMVLDIQWRVETLGLFAHAEEGPRRYALLQRWAFGGRGMQP